MGRVMMMGPVSCGKTTLCRYLNGLPRIDAKTQTVEQIGDTIDTPGEYMESRRWWNRLLVTASDADLVFFLQDCTNPNFRYAPGQAAMFNCPVAGVLTKIDLVDEEEILRTRELLSLTGASPLFAVSSHSGEGIEALAEFISTHAGPNRVYSSSRN
jgi:ethanolamine utilization protein EutP